MRTSPLKRGRSGGADKSNAAKTDIVGGDGVGVGGDSDNSSSSKNTTSSFLLERFLDRLRRPSGGEDDHQQQQQQQQQQEKWSPSPTVAATPQLSTQHHRYSINNGNGASGCRDDNDPTRKLSTASTASASALEEFYLSRPDLVLVARQQQQRQQQQQQQRQQQRNLVRLHSRIWRWLKSKTISAFQVEMPP